MNSDNDSEQFYSERNSKKQEQFDAYYHKKEDIPYLLTWILNKFSK